MTTSFAAPVDVGIRLRLIRAYVRRKLKSGLDGVYAKGRDDARRLVHEHPLIICSNHIAWWDPLVLIAVGEALGMRGRCLMDERSLKQLGFFRWVGAIPIDMQNPKRSIKQLKEAGASAAKGDPIWIFPSGEYKRPHVDELAFKSGLVRLCKAAPEGAKVLPIALDAGFKEANATRYVIGFGRPLSAEDCAQRGGEKLVERGVLNALEGLWDHTDLTPLLTSAKERELDGIGARMLTLFSRKGRDKRALLTERERT